MQLAGETEGPRMAVEPNTNVGLYVVLHDWERLEAQGHRAGR